MKLKVADFDGKPTVGRFTFTDAAGPRLSRRRPSGSRPTSSSRSRSTGPTAAPCCCRRANSRSSTAAGRNTGSIAQKINVAERAAGREHRRRQARTLDQPGRLRLVQRRPPHPRRRLRPLHQPDRGRAARGHVPARQGRGAERRLLPDLGAVLRLPAASSSRPVPHKLSEPFTVLKYDVEVSGFGSQALGHVCLLNLRDQTYPRFGRDQDQGLADLDDAAHAAGPRSRAPSPATPTRPTALGQHREAPPRRLFAELDANKDGSIIRTRRRPASGRCPSRSPTIDANGDGKITARRARRRAPAGDRPSCRT